MKTSKKNRQRAQLQVEPLEGKTLLSAGSVIDHVAAAPMVAPAAALGGTLAGFYSEVHAPYFANIQSFNTSGTLSGVGWAHSVGTLFVRAGNRAGRPVGQLVVRNSGGVMILHVFGSGTPGIYAYRVARAGGGDAGFRGDTGTLTTTLNPTFRVPYYTYGHATITLA